MQLLQRKCFAPVLNLDNKKIKFISDRNPKKQIFIHQVQILELSLNRV